MICWLAVKRKGWMVYTHYLDISFFKGQATCFRQTAASLWRLVGQKERHGLETEKEKLLKVPSQITDFPKKSKGWEWVFSSCLWVSRWRKDPFSSAMESRTRTLSSSSEAFGPTMKPSWQIVSKIPCLQNPLSVMVHLLIANTSLVIFTDSTWSLIIVFELSNAHLVHLHVNLFDFLTPNSASTTLLPLIVHRRLFETTVFWKKSNALQGETISAIYTSPLTWHVCVLHWRSSSSTSTLPSAWEACSDPNSPKPSSSSAFWDWTSTNDEVHEGLRVS